MASATMATMVATGNRRSRMHGTPAILSGEDVIRVNSISSQYRLGPLANTGHANEAAQRPTQMTNAGQSGVGHWVDASSG